MWKLNYGTDVPSYKTETDSQTYKVRGNVGVGGDKLGTGG